MSIRHPIIVVTGSSGAGTTTVKNTFVQIFRREGVRAAYIEGDAFHRHDRDGMQVAIADAESRGNPHFSHFSPDANLLDELGGTFEEFAAKGTGRTRHYVHDEIEARAYGCPSGTFTPGGSSIRTSMCCSTRACTVPWSRRRWTSPRTAT